MLTSNYARLALLLEPNTEEVQQKAKEAYDAAPDDANCTVTYAYALYKAGRTPEGLEVLKKLLPEQLEDPHVAVYMAVLLLDNNQAEAAKEYIEDAQKGSSFPEEKKLLKEAVAQAAATPSPTPAPPPEPSPEASTPPDSSPSPPLL